MQRRMFLKWAGVGTISSLAGCQSDTEQDTGSTPTNTPQTTPTTTRTDTPSETPTPTETNTETQTTTETDTADYYIHPEGENENDGTQESPLRTIQEGFNRAQPGETIHARPGVHRVQNDVVATKRPGAKGNPITLTGPPDAVLTGPKDAHVGPHSCTSGTATSTSPD